MRMPARLPNPGGQKIFVPGQRVFIPRVQELRALEGWYQAPLYKFKVSCSFNDILRCSRTSHFSSCFKDEGEYTGTQHGWVARGVGLHHTQPLKRCYDSNWAIIYVPDKRGDFLGRCFLRFVPSGSLYTTDFSEHRSIGDQFHLGRIYGNALTYKDIITAIPQLNSTVQGAKDSYI